MEAVDDIVQKVQNLYDEAGEYFSRTRQKQYGASKNWLVTEEYLGKLKKGERVLDVGCGDGRLLSGLPMEIEYLGIDFSKTLLAIARRDYPEREFRFGNIIEPLVWEGIGRFEAVFCVATLHHVPKRSEQLTVLKRMRKAATKGGRLYLTVWNLWQARMIERGLTGGVRQAGEVVEIDFAGYEGRYVVAMDLAYIVKLLDEAGWGVEEVFYASPGGERVGIVDGANLVVRALN